MARILILVISAIPGVAAAAAYIGYYASPRIQSLAIPRGDREWLEMLMVLDACVIFYAVTFAACRFLSRLCLNGAALDDLRLTSRKLSIRMNIISGFTLMAAYGTLKSASTINAWLHIIAGIFLLALGMRKLRRATRETGEGVLEYLFGVK